MTKPAPVRDQTHRSCRFCAEPLAVTFADLGSSPPSNRYMTPAQLEEMEPWFPLHAFVCESCFLVQLEEFQPPEDHFTADYAYFSSYADSWLTHCSAYADMISDRLGLNETSKVVELASNDGYLLQYFKAKNIPVLGVEPAANVAKAAMEKNIPTKVEFFGVDCARKLKSDGVKADLLIGNNVLAHVPDINDFVGGMKILLAENGVITMEFPHLLQQITHNQFDTIYHEHFSYLSLLSVEKIFAHHGLSLFDVDEVITHGGSLRIYACHAGKRDAEKNLIAVRGKEKDSKLDQMETYEKFSQQVRETKRALLEFLIAAKRDGKTIVGYGAPAKGNTLLNYCGIRGDFVDYTVDRSPHKQNKFLPGSRIPIYAPEKISETKPDYVLILPWNFKDEVMNQMAHIRDWGGKFVVPIPRVQVID